MKVLNKKSFKLPFIGKDRYVQLLRLGLGYDRGSFYIKTYNDVERIVDTISDILAGEEISFLQTCILCGIDFPCSDCKYNSLCATKDLPLQCICPNCRGHSELYTRHVKRDLGL